MASEVMNGHSRTRAVVIAMMLAAAPASAQSSDPTPPTESLAVSPSTSPRLRRSDLWATVHVVGVDLGIFAIGRISGLVVGGREYLDITPDTVWRNITGSWEWDEDDFSVDQFRGCTARSR